MARVLFALAALYNLAFAVWAGLWPDRVFAVLGVAPPWPAFVTRMMAASIAAFGIAYAYAVKRPQRARWIAAAGLAAKILPPLAWIVAVASGAWPLRTGVLILLDDVVWWIPFAIYLRSRIVA